jgi:hypothetical protein
VEPQLSLLCSQQSATCPCPMPDEFSPRHPMSESYILKLPSLLRPDRLCLKCAGTRAETRFRLSAKRTSPFQSAGASVQSTSGSRGVRKSGSNAGYTMFRGSVKNTGYPLHSPVSPSLPLPCVTVCHHISTGLYPKCFLSLSVPTKTLY